MSLSLGLVGLPNAGKSTLFNALTHAGAAVAAYPFTTIDPNVGQAAVPDNRLAVIAGVTRPQRIVPATVQFVDIAGLVRRASQGEGLGNQFLAHIRDVDAIVHVVRCFTAADVARAEGALYPVSDVELIETELALADLETVERAIDRAGTRAKTGDGTARAQAVALRRVADRLAQGVPVRREGVDASLEPVLRELRLLTGKPVLFVANVDEDSLPDGGACGSALRVLADRQNAGCLVLAARLEVELFDLPPEDARAYLAAVGLSEPGLPRLIRASFDLVDLVSFFTILSDEVRAWSIARGTPAVEAAGRIHTDMARGFVRAEVIPWQSLIAAGSLHAARERGLVRLEGRDYVVADGDVITFRFAA